MKGYRRSRSTAPLILDLVIRGNWRTSSSDRFIPSKNPGTHWTGGWVGHIPSLGRFAENLLSLPGFEPRTVQPVQPSRYTDSKRLSIQDMNKPWSLKTVTNITKHNPYHFYRFLLFSCLMKYEEVNGRCVRLLSSPKRPDRLCGPRSLLSIGTAVLSLGVLPTTRHHSAPMLWTSGAKPLNPLYDITAWTGTLARLLEGSGLQSRRDTCCFHLQDCTKQVIPNVRHICIRSSWL